MITITPPASPPGLIIESLTNYDSGGGSLRADDN